MSERRNAASLLSHSVKAPLASIKVAAQLLRKHVQNQLSEKDLELLDAIIRNAATLEARLNKMIELATPWQDRVFLELEVEQLEAIHSLKIDAKESKSEKEASQNLGKVVVHADPEIADLIPKFLDNRQKDIVAIELALAQNDFQTIRLLGHSMKGAGGGYGFDGVTEIGKNLEEAAIEENSDGIRKGIVELAEYLRNVEVIYDEQ
jgi:HPt (histidine-containing phosphotransfer) domain-containing protein